MHTTSSEIALMSMLEALAKAAKRRIEDVNAQGEETGIKLPYIVTLLPKQSTVLSMRRNYNQQDPMRKRVD